MKWLPIETAPKHDGAVIWAYSDGEQARMRWCVTPDGDLWIWDDEILSDAEPDPLQPTHWMPLPPPPTDTAAH